MRYNLVFTAHFERDHYKLIKKDQLLAKRIDKVVDQLRKDPFYSGLLSHVVEENSYLGNIYSSRVTGDIRILWAFDPKQNLILILLKVGGHDDVY